MTGFAKYVHSLPLKKRGVFANKSSPLIFCLPKIPRTKKTSILVHLIPKPSPRDVSRFFFQEHHQVDTEGICSNLEPQKSPLLGTV